MRYLKNHRTDPYFNMAFDEYCLEQLAIDEPVFYLWQNRPSVIIGANQEVHTEVNIDYLKANGIALARRVGSNVPFLLNLEFTITVFLLFAIINFLASSISCFFRQALMRS